MKMVMESSSITTTNSSTSNQIPVTSNSTESNNCQSSNNVPLFNPQSLGREFVRQYYTVLNEGPHIMHRFYSEDSSLVHGGSNKQGESTVYGQESINEKILSLNFKDCHTKIRQVDSMETVGKGVVVQVIGELSNNGKPMRRFFQTFVLAPRSPSNYYVRNDIFRYQDEVFTDDDDYGDVEKVDDIEKKGDVQSPAGDAGTEAEVTSTTPTAMTPTAVSPSDGAKDVFESPNVNGAASHNEISSTEKLSSSDTDGTTSKSENSFVNVDDGWSVSNAEEANDDRTSVKDENGSHVPSYASIISSVQQNHIHNFSNKVDGNVGVTSGLFTKPSTDVPAGTPSYMNQFGNSGKSNFNTKSSNFSNKSGYSRDPKPNRPRAHQGGPKQKSDVKESTPAFNDQEYFGESNESFGVGGRKQQQQPQQFSDDHQVFVGNLPQEITEGQLQEFFSKYGNIVDVRINRTNQKSGRTPNYGFVTFDDPSIVKHILTLKPIFFNDHRFNVEEKRSQSTRSTGGAHIDRPGRDNSRSVSSSGNVGGSGNQGSNMTRAINNTSGVSSGRAPGLQSGQRRERSERNSFGANDSGRRNGGGGGVGPPRGGSTYGRR